MTQVVRTSCCAVFVAAVLLGWAAGGHAAAVSQTGPGLNPILAPLVGESDAVMVTTPQGQVLAAIHPDRPRVPASILKVLTALAALHYLGEEFRFPTDFYATPENDLIVKGYGDPLLVSERLDHIARRLSRRIQHVNDLVLDDSYFSHPIRIPGRSRSAEPYDAPNGALCVNFNTVHFERRNGRWLSAEPQTPLLPSAMAGIEASGLTAGRITLSPDRADILNYAGELMTHFLEASGVSMQGRIRFGRADSESHTLLWRHYSDKPLTKVIEDLLAFSNNFIANQLLLAIGAHVASPPADMDKGVEALRRYYESVLDLHSGYLDEGSGISRRNRLTARAMTTILEKFEPYHALMRRQGRQYYKTGTLNGVHTRAGYLESAGDGLYRFVVMLNTPGKSTHRIMRVIERELK